MPETKKFPRILGVNQMADETSLDDKERDAMFVRKAVNVDIDADGNVSRRAGANLELSGSGYHSLYSSNRGWLMMCKNHQLGVYSEGAFTPLVNMNGSNLTSYAELNRNLYAMNSTFSCKFTPGSLEYKPIGVPLKTSIWKPEFTATAGGLPEGTYGVTYTVVDPDGEESGTGPVTTLELPSGGGIQGGIFEIASGYKYRIYLTRANGELLYRAAEFDANTNYYTVSTVEEGPECETHGLDQPPNGYILRAHGSRLLIGATGYVYFTEAFRPHLHDPRSFVPISGFCNMVESVDSGVFISDDHGVRFYAGDDPTAWEVKDASAEKAIFGTSLKASGADFGEQFARYDAVAVWLTSTGYQIGLPTGEVVRLNAGQVRTPAYTQGCSAMVISGGRKQIVSPVNSNELAGASVSLDSTTI